MIKKKVNITVKTRQSDYVDINEKKTNEQVEGEDTRAEIFSEGELAVTEDGSVTLSYDESELTDVPFSLTSLHFNKENPELVTLMRSGQFRVAMVFEPYSRHICVYETPYMPIEMCIATHSLTNAIGEDGGSLFVRYSIETNGMRCELATIEMDVSPVD